VEKDSLNPSFIDLTLALAKGQQERRILNLPYPLNLHLRL
jgi:hypothetical protein